MTIQHQTTVKSWFEAGDVPTQSQFADFIESSMPEWQVDAAIQAAAGNTGPLFILSSVSATVGGGSGIGAGVFGTHMLGTQTTAAAHAALNAGAFGIQMLATTTTAAGRALTNTDIIYADDFGCYPDGNDCTTAFQLAYNAACSVKGTLMLRSGVYLTTGIKLATATARYCTIQGESRDLAGNAGGTVIRHMAGSTGPLITISANNVGGPQRLKSLVLDGNKTNTSGTQGIYVQDYAAGPPAGGYYWGLYLDDVQILSTRGTGVYIGEFAAGNRLRYVSTYSCGISATNYGIHIRSYDVEMDYININSSSGDGIFFENTSQVRGYSINSFYNGRAGMVIAASAADITLIGGSMDHNQQDGIQITEYLNPTTYAARRFISGMKFLANGQLTNNTYCDFSPTAKIRDATLTGCSFMGSDSANKVQYFVNGASGSSIRVFGNSYNHASVGSGVFGDRTWVYGDSSDGAAGNLKVSPAPLPFYTVTTLPSPQAAGTMAYVSNASGNRNVVFADGVNWRTMVGEVVTAAG